VTSRLGRTDLAQSDLALLTAVPSSLAARVFARETLRRWQISDVGDDVVLVVGELVANAVVHTAGPVTVALGLWGQHIRVEVGDESSSLPNAQQPSSDGTSGRGIAIVASLSREWGVHLRTDGGKSVWADIELVG
jgi:anti-sigma regulatory factor (Ser/Thr protein kinase)